MKLGSLFDGSGGFPLAGTINGITPPGQKPHYNQFLDMLKEAGEE